MGLGLDLSKVETKTNDFTPIPDGTYECYVDKAEVVPTKTGGEMIKVQFKVRGPGYEGRTVFDSFNIKNSSAQAVEIGMSQLKNLLTAGGAANPNHLDSTSELVGLNVVLRVKTETDANWGPQTRVKGYYPITGTKFENTATTPNESW